MPDMFTELALALIAGVTTLGVAVINLLGRRSKSNPKPDAEIAEENQLAHETNTPASPGGEDYKGASLMSLSISVQHLSKEIKDTESRHTRDLELMNQRISRIQHSYDLLYAWAQKVIKDWTHLRLEERPYPLPEGIHHPE